MSELFSGLESFQSYMDTEVTSTIKVGDSDDVDGASTPVEVVEDTIATEEKVDQDLEDTSKEIEEETKAAESLIRMAVQQLDLKKHIKQFGMSADMYAFVNHTTNFYNFATVNGFSVPQVSDYNSNSAAHRQAIMEASDGLLKRMGDNVIKFFKWLGRKLKEFWEFIKEKMKAVDLWFASALDKIKDIPSNLKAHWNETFDVVSEDALQNVEDARKHFEEVLEKCVKFSAMESDVKEVEELVMQIHNLHKGLVDAKTKTIPCTKISSANDLEKVISRAKRLVREHYSELTTLDKLKNFVDKVTSNISGLFNKENPDEAKEKLTLLQKLGKAVSKLTDTLSGFWGWIINSCRTLFNKFMAAIGKGGKDELSERTDADKKVDNQPDNKDMTDNYDNYRYSQESLVLA